MNLLSDSYKLVPKINDLWNFYSKLYKGDLNMIMDETLDQLSERTGIDKSDLKNVLDTLDTDKLKPEEKVVVDNFYMIFYENMLKDRDFRKKLIAERLRHYELSFNEIKELLKSIENKDTYKILDDKIKYINMIRSEIESCISKLEQDEIQLLPLDKWMSAISSGSLKLFEVDTELQSLSTVYDKIRDFNERAKEQRFSGYPWDRLKRENGNRLPIYQVKQFLRIREDLLHELNILKDIEWLNPQT